MLQFVEDTIPPAESISEAHVDLSQCAVVLGIRKLKEPTSPKAGSPPLVAQAYDWMDYASPFPAGEW